MTPTQTEDPRPAGPTSADIVLRPVVLSDAAGCHRISRIVSWPHRQEDWEMFIRLGGGVVAANGEVIAASALWWPYGDKAATLGMIIVDPGLQGAGLGRRLMQALFAEAGERVLMLNSTAAGMQLYSRNGFVPCGTISQYQGTALPPAPEPLASGERLRPGTVGDIAIIAQLDHAASGLPREPALLAILERGECAILERNGEPVGFSVLRPFGRGEAIGPVVAPGEREARLLIACWLGARAGGFVRIDIPARPELAHWLTRHGLESAGDVVMMARGEKPAGAGPACIYAVISQALG